MGLEDKDLLIDLQVGSKKEITNIYITNKIVVKKKEEKPIDLLAEREKKDGKQSFMSGGAEMAKFEIGLAGDVFDKIHDDDKKVTTRDLEKDHCGKKMEKSRIEY